VFAAVNARQLFAARLPRRDDLALPLPPLLRDDIHHFGTLRRLGMARGRLVIGEPLRGDQNQGHGSANSTFSQ
jgi:hypothetical protein